MPTNTVSTTATRPDHRNMPDESPNRALRYAIAAGSAAILIVAMIVGARLLSTDSGDEGDFAGTATEYLPATPQQSSSEDAPQPEPAPAADATASAWSDPALGLDEVRTTQQLDTDGNPMTLIAVSGDRNSVNNAEWLITDRSGAGWESREFSGNSPVSAVADVRVSQESLAGVETTIVNTEYRNKPIGQSTAYARPNDNTLVIAIGPKGSTDAVSAALEEMLSNGRA